MSQSTSGILVNIGEFPSAESYFELSSQFREQGDFAQSNAWKWIGLQCGGFLGHPRGVSDPVKIGRYRTLEFTLALEAAEGRRRATKDLVTALKNTDISYGQALGESLGGAHSRLERTLKGYVGGLIFLLRNFEELPSDLRERYLDSIPEQIPEGLENFRDGFCEEFERILADPPNGFGDAKAYSDEVRLESYEYFDDDAEFEFHAGRAHASNLYAMTLLPISGEFV